MYCIELYCGGMLVDSKCLFCVVVFTRSVVVIVVLVLRKFSLIIKKKNIYRI
jgi:hypothetical protein